MHCTVVGSCREDKLTGLTAVAATCDPGQARMMGLPYGSGIMAARVVALDILLFVTSRR